MLNKISHSLIARLLTCEANEKDKKRLDKMIDDGQFSKHALEQIKSAWDQPVFSELEIKIINQEEISEKVWQQSIKSYKSSFIRKGKNVNRFFLLKVAASILILAATLFSIYYFIQQDTEKSVEVRWMLKQNPAGQKSKIFLPDGSVVWLNAASTLQYAENFSDSNRYITLKGEAYFEVEKDVNRPFIVNCGQILTTALGTKFDINGFKENAVNISLLQGSVIVNSERLKDDKGRMLNPGEFIVFNNNGENFERGEFDIDDITAWKEGILIFKDATFDEIKDKLEIWFGTEIIFNASTKYHKHYNGRFNNENLQNILESLSFAFDFQYQLKNKTVTIN